MSKRFEARLRRIDGPVTTARGDNRMAWFTLPPQRGSFQSVAATDGLIKGGGLCYSGLVGHRIHLRVTNVPYPVDQWARALDENTPDPLPGWSKHLIAEQHRVRSLTLSEKLVHLGVDLTAKPRKRAEELATVAAAVAGYGLEGRPITAGELEWLLHRSVALGAPAPVTMPPPRTVWEPDDLADLTDHVDWWQEPGDRTVTVSADVNGVKYEQHVAILTCCRMDDVAIPEEMEPWMQRTDRLQFPVEWSVIADVLEPAVTIGRMKDVVLRATSQIDHYVNEHKQRPPESTVGKRDKAHRIQDEMRGDNPLAVRMDWWARIAVSGATEAEALARASKVVKEYSPRLTFDRCADQYFTALEFVPGERLANTAHRRQGPVTVFGAGVPMMTSAIGDRIGENIGETCGASRRAVMWDMWRSMEVLEESGLTVVTGGLGAGKSVFGGCRLVGAAERGIKAVALDPAGRLSKLCQLEHLAAYSESIDLMRDQTLGSLNPYWIINDPLREHYATDEEFSQAMEFTAAERVVLVNDTLLGLLAPATAKSDRTVRAIDKATGAVPGHRSSSPLQVIDALRALTGDLAEHGDYLADAFKRIAKLPQGRRIFPEARDQWRNERPADDEHVLRVLTMRGNSLPPADTKAADWTLAQRLAVAALTLAFVLTIQHVVSRDPSERKLIVIDEAHVIAAFPAGAAALSQITRDFTRKWNVRLILLTHQVEDLTGLEEFIDTVFAGRTTSEKAQKDTLRVMGVERGVGFEKVLGGLSEKAAGADSHLGYREYVMKDSQGAVEKIRCEWPERVRVALNTTAAPRHAAEPEMAVA